MESSLASDNDGRILCANMRQKRQSPDDAKLRTALEKKYGVQGLYTR